MKILAVDNEEIALTGLCKAIKQALPDAEIFSTQNSSEALSMALHCEPAVAFLDIEMPKVNGLELAKQLKKEVNPKINIIFTTGYNEYIVEAFTKLRVSGYLMKPITKEMILNEIENLRYPHELKWEGRISRETLQQSMPFEENTCHNTPGPKRLWQPLSLQSRTNLPIWEVFLCCNGGNEFFRFFYSFLEIRDILFLLCDI